MTGHHGEVRRAITAGLVVIAILSGCGEDDDAASPSSTSATSTSESPDPPVFCSAMRDLQSSGAQAPAELEAIYSDVAANAPREIEDEVSSFLRYSRAVSEAFVAAGAPDSEVDAEAVVASLSADERQFVEDLATVRPPDFWSILRESLGSSERTGVSF